MQNIVFGASESCINCYCLILLVFIFVYLYLFGLKRGLKILFGQFWSPKNLLLPMPAGWYGSHPFESCSFYSCSISCCFFGMETIFRKAIIHLIQLNLHENVLFSMYFNLLYWSFLFNGFYQKMIQYLIPIHFYLDLHVPIWHHQRRINFLFPTEKF